MGIKQNTKVYLVRCFIRVYVQRISMDPDWRQTGPNVLLKKSFRLVLTIITMAIRFPAYWQAGGRS